MGLENKTVWMPWVWRQIAFRLPADWEMLQFSKKTDKGGCSFADRHQFRFQLVWSEVPGPPDTHRMLSDYRSRLELSDGLTDAVEEQHGDWVAISGLQDGKPITRFGRYLEEAGLVAELVFLHPDTRDEDCEQEVLASCAACPEEKDMHTWCAGGMHFQIRADLPFDDLRMAPAQVRFQFKDAKTMDQEQFERLGMVSQWLQGSLESWFDAARPVTVKEWHTQTRPHAGTRALTGEGLLPGTRKWGPARRFQAAAWIDPIDGRLYHWRRIRKSRDAVPSTDIPLSPQSPTTFPQNGGNR